MYTRNCEIKSGVEFPQGMRRIALQVEYRGTGLKGFQRQSSAANTVQAYLEKGLSFVADEPITLKCAGRTDAGVHGMSQWVHFDTQAPRDMKAWTKGVNSRMPRDVRVVNAFEVAPEFHARFSAQAREYCYVLYPSATPSAILHGLVTNLSYKVDTKAMSEACKHLLGEHDFSAFRAANCQAASPVREISRADFIDYGHYLALHIKANGFLYHMVRNIVGSLIEVGRGEKPSSWINDLIKGRDRKLAAAKAPACGLYFVGVQYPEEFGLPLGPILPPMLSQAL